MYRYPRPAAAPAAPIPIVENSGAGVAVRADSDFSFVPPVNRVDFPVGSAGTFTSNLSTAFPVTDVKPVSPIVEIKDRTNSAATTRQIRTAVSPLCLNTI